MPIWADGPLLIIIVPFRHTAIPNREVCIGVYTLYRQILVNENRDPAMRFLPVGIDFQGVPRKPYRVWVCSAPYRQTLCLFFPYSHLSNKRDVTLSDFEKFHPQQKKSPPPRLLIS